MNNNEFVGYIGNTDFHDGRIIKFSHEADNVSVKLLGAGGKEYIINFNKVSAVRFNNPERMMIYSINEIRLSQPKRLFVFVNWDEEDKSFLEIEAENFNIALI